MQSSLNNWLKSIQHADRETKKFWLILLSGITMIFVVTLWFFYFRYTTPYASTKKEGEIVEVPQDSSYLKDVGKEAKTFMSQLSSAYSATISKVRGTKDIILEGGQGGLPAFQIDERVPSTPLP